MKVTPKRRISQGNTVYLLALDCTDSGVCLTVTCWLHGRIPQQCRGLTKWLLLRVRSIFEPQDHDSLGISPLSVSWESRLGVQGGGNESGVGGTDVEECHTF